MLCATDYYYALFMPALLIDALRNTPGDIDHRRASQYIKLPRYYFHNIIGLHFQDYTPSLPTNISIAALSLTALLRRSPLSALLPPQRAYHFTTTERRALILAPRRRAT